MKKLTCRCDYVVELDVPDVFDIDADPSFIARLADGDSPSAVCPRCGAVVRAELPLRLSSSARGIDLVVLPEADRLAVYRGKADPGRTSEILLGYQELFERARALRDGLDPRAVEALKYALQGKAEESEPTADIAVLYNGERDSSLEFHILGLKSGQAGVVRLPRASYDKIALDAKSSFAREPFKAIFSGRYLSIKKLGFLSSTSEA
ncbi:MAG: CpXC domain-containing protein [Spirochaetes bacterium]|nr:CpXC domain-containing protein [Spirochaetota bacterium]MBU1081358.1 CpXC domain-containing protein [Spirochaetota bacterium]